MSDSLAERQKIDRCASATDTVPSKMSRWNTTRNQPSVENCHTTPPYSPGVRKE
jgi:hypothetical protein